MTLGTIFSSMLNAGEVETHRPQRTALVLMGGGARTSYQAGVLQGVQEILGPTPRAFFDLLVGTSAGALNAAFLAARARDADRATQRLVDFWMEVRSTRVYRVESLRLPKGLRWATLLSPAWTMRRLPRSLLDATPLVDTLRRSIEVQYIGRSLEEHALEGLAITASSYTTGVHWTFCQVASSHRREPWSRPGRRASFEPVTHSHLLASSAIPFIFPSIELQVDGHSEYFGDGSMRQISPLGPAMNLGATRIMAIGVGQPQRSGMGLPTPHRRPGAPAAYPSMAQIGSHALASVFHDTLAGDVEQALRVNESLRRIPSDMAGMLPYRPVSILSIQPSQSVDALALQHLRALPPPAYRLLKMLGGTQEAGAALASYLLFEPPFVQALLALGRTDALMRRQEIERFFAPTPPLAVADPR